MHPTEKRYGEPVIDLRLLGPPTLHYRTQPFTLPRRQARALLFRLAADRQPVPREALSDLFWPDRAPPAARRNLIRLLSYLRTQLPSPNLIQVNKTAVSLQPRLVTSDVMQFTDLSHSDDPAHWETAASLYRGSFLAGFVLKNSPEFDNWLSREQRRWEKLYLETLRRLVGAYAGEPARAIPFAQRYLALDDLAEAIHRQLITLYVASGRRSAALKQYETCVVVLERELGVSPLPETRAAYEAARSSERLAAYEVAPTPEWTALPGSDLPLVGREAALTALEEAYARFHDGGVIFIAGAAGAGKSRLMQTFANGQKVLILSGNSHAEGTDLSYQPLVQALRQALALHDRWEQISPVWLAELSRLLPELRVHFPDLPAPVDVEPQQAQVHLFEALRQVFRGLAIGSPLLLCLDDVHWADESTKEWLLYFARQLRGSRVCILATYRAHEQQAVASWQRTLKRGGMMATLALDGLSTTAVAELLRQLDSRPPKPEQLARRIHAATGGNAYFVLETIRELTERKLIDDKSATLPLSPTVRDAVLHRAGNLTTLARQIVEVIAVLSPIATLDHIAETAGRDRLETATALEELTHHQLLRTDDSNFQIQHDLAREAIYQHISPWRRRLLHQRAARAMKMSSGRVDWAASIATHLEIAGKFGQAASYYQQAAHLSQTVYANRETIQYYEKAIALSKKENTSDKLLKLQIALYEELGRILRRQAQYERAENAFQSMRKIAVTLGDPEMSAQSYLRLGQVLDSMKRYTESLTSAVHAVELSTQYKLDDTLASALYAKSWALFRLQKLEEALPIALSALELSTQLKNLDIQARSQNTIGAIYKFLGRYDLSEQHQQSALELFQQLGDTRRVAGMFSNLGETARLRRDFAGAHPLYQQAVTIAREIGEKDWLVEFLNNLGFAQFQLGKLGAAERSFYEAIEVAKAASIPEDANVYKNLCMVHLAQAQLAKALVAGQNALDLSQKSQQHMITAEVWFLLGKISLARSSPISIASTDYDAKACLTESLRLFTIIDDREKATGVSQFLLDQKLK